MRKSLRKQPGHFLDDFFWANKKRHPLKHVSNAKFEMLSKGGAALWGPAKDLWEVTAGPSLAGLNIA